MRCQDLFAAEEAMDIRAVQQLVYHRVIHRPKPINDPSNNIRVNRRTLSLALKVWTNSTAQRHTHERVTKPIPLAHNGPLRPPPPTRAHLRLPTPLPFPPHHPTPLRLSSRLWGRRIHLFPASSFNGSPTISTAVLSRRHAKFSGSPSIYRQRERRKLLGINPRALRDS